MFFYFLFSLDFILVLKVKTLFKGQIYGISVTLQIVLNFHTTFKCTALQQESTPNHLVLCSLGYIKKGWFKFEKSFLNDFFCYFHCCWFILGSMVGVLCIQISFVNKNKFSLFIFKLFELML